MRKLCKVCTISLLAGALVVTPVFAEPSVDDLESSKAAAESEVNTLQSELSATLEKITSLEAELQEKTEAVVKTNEELEEAAYQERQQYSDMKLRIQYMYEEGDGSVVETLLSAKSFSDLVNKAEYVQNVHSYDKQKLEEYIKTKEKVETLKNSLDTEVETMQSKQAALQEEKVSLSSTISSKQSQIAQLDQSIQDALAAAVEEQQAAGEAGGSAQDDADAGATDQGGSGNGGGNDDKHYAPPSGGSGSAVANYACQFVGNKYEYGGSSLTNGTDCSGFTMAVYAAFGVSLPHNDAAQEACGRAVSYSEAQPGDLIFYGGHVGIYIGGGSIVHASNSAPYPEGGIKISSATYRTIKCVRRIF
ncbi:MAG: NlpC/P60 family protein [Clostridia bacterium]